MANDTQRMQEIQNALISHIQTQLTSDEDFMYVATMLLKHSLVLYKTFLDDEQIQMMLAHVAKTIADDLDVNDYTTSNNDGGTTRH